MHQCFLPGLVGRYTGLNPKDTLMEKVIEDLMIVQGIAFLLVKKLLKMLILVPKISLRLIRIILIGTAFGGVTVYFDAVQSLIEKGHRKITPFFMPYAISNTSSAMLAIDLGFTGPSYSISSACATSNHCFHAAANHIRRGEADMMVAGGTEAPITPIGLGGFVALNALSRRNGDPQTASRPWDKNRDGFVMGEGAGVLVMESLEHAIKRDAPIYAEYLGGAVNCDAYHITRPWSDGLSVSCCIKSCLKDAGVSTEEVNYINAHATSTLIGDLAEVNAIKKVFKSTAGIKMNSTKEIGIVSLTAVVILFASALVVF